MHKILTAALFFAHVAVVLPFACSPIYAQKTTKTKRAKPVKKTIQPIEDKIIYEPDAELLETLRTKVTVVESKKDWTQFNRQRPIGNSDGTRAAYVAQFKVKDEPDAFTDVIVVYEKASDKFYEIRGIDDFPWRPFDAIKWRNADVLEFEQWVNPNNGGRYAVNLKTGKIVAAGYVRSN